MARVAPNYRHDAPLHWHARDAPHHNATGDHTATWRGRVAAHRAANPALFPAQRAAPSMTSPERRVSYRQADSEDEDLALFARTTAEPTFCHDLPAPVPPSEDESRDGSEDFWSVLVRVDFERYALLKNDQLHVSSVEKLDAVPAFEDSGVWTILTQAIAFERTTLRRYARSQQWPDTMRSASTLTEVEAAELQVKLHGWIDALDEARGDDTTREALQVLPVDALMLQLLSDVQFAAGDVDKAAYSLYNAVTNKQPEIPVALNKARVVSCLTPLLVAWEDRFDCFYVKAQQCLRFGRIALRVCEQLSTESAEQGGALAALREKQSANDRAELAGKAKRHFTDARRLYTSELHRLDSELAGRHPQYKSGHMSASDSWRLVLRCARLAATGLLVSACVLLGQEAAAQKALNEALFEAASLAVTDGATPLLQRVILQEHARLSSISVTLEHGPVAK